MKLKQILLGLTASILALTSVAVASFTSSAADTIEPSNGWYETIGKLEADQFKLIQDWGNQTKLPELYQKNELYIAIDVKGITTPIAAYMIFSNGAGWEAWNSDVNGNPSVQIDKDGVYVIPWKGTSYVNAEIVLFLAAEFTTADSSAVYFAADNGVTCSLVGVYLTDPTDELINNNDNTSNSSIESSSELSSESSSKSSNITLSHVQTNNITTTSRPITTVSPEKPTKTTIVKPKKVTKLGKVKIKPVLNYKAKKVKIKWKKVRGATGYQYKISLNKKYKKAKIKSTKKKSFSFKFKLNKNYKVGVRAYKKVGNKKDYGKWTIKNIDFRTK